MNVTDINFYNIYEHRSIITLPDEEWQPITDFEESYRISSYGRVISIIGKPKILKPADNGGGYMTVRLWNGIKYKMKYIHRLVCEHFIPNLNNLPQVNHKQTGLGKHDNRVDYLEWCTARENIKDAHKNGQMVKRSLVNKLESQEDNIIQEMYYKVKTGSGVGEVARQYGVKRTTLSSIVNKRSRRNITDLVDKQLQQIEQSLVDNTQDPA